MKNITLHVVPKTEDVVIINHNTNKKYHITEEIFQTYKTWSVYDLFQNIPDPRWKEIKDDTIKYKKNPNVTYLPPESDADGIDFEYPNGDKLRMLFDYCKFCKSRPVYMYGIPGNENSQFQVCELHAKEFDVD